MVRQLKINDIEELFATLRLSNSNLFGDEIISPWVRGQPDANQRLLPKVWRDDFLLDPRFIARDSLYFRMAEEATRSNPMLLSAFGEEYLARH